MSDALQAFLAAIEDDLGRPAENIALRLTAGGLIRFEGDGDRKGKANCWAVFHTDGRPAGAYGSYRLGISKTWRADQPTTPASRAEREAQREAWRKLKAERQSAIEAGWEEAAVSAANLLARSILADPAHRYLVRKRIDGEGLRQHRDMLLAPMRDGAGRVWNVQRIAPDGTKRFLKGGRTAGLFWLCGDPDAVICTGEGVATVAAVRRATGHAVAAAFSAGNLEPVARVVQAAWPNIDQIIIADDDAHLIHNPRIARNVGVDAAHAAAAAVGGRVAMPPRGK